MVCSDMEAVSVYLEFTSAMVIHSVLGFQFWGETVRGGGLIHHPFILQLQSS